MKEEFLQHLNALSTPEVANLMRYCKIRLENATKDKRAYTELSFERYAQIYANMSPQCYGKKFETFIKGMLSEIADEVKPEENRGDFKIKQQDRYYETKSTVLNSKGKINMVQVRPYQKLIGCVYVIVKPEVWVDRYGCELFLIPKEIIDALVFKKGGLAHGTVISTMNNESKEYRITLNYRKEETKNFLMPYKVSGFDELKKKLMETE